MGMFDIFKRNKPKDGQVYVIEPDQASGDEPLTRHPGSWMTENYKTEEETHVKLYIVHETKVPVDSVANWYVPQLKTNGWKFITWNPTSLIDKGVRGVIPIITMNCEKRNFEENEWKTCSIGIRWYPTHTKIVVTHWERIWRTS